MQLITTGQRQLFAVSVPRIEPLEPIRVGARLQQLRQYKVLVGVLQNQRHIGAVTALAHLRMGKLCGLVGRRKRLAEAGLLEREACIGRPVVLDHAFHVPQRAGLFDAQLTGFGHLFHKLARGQGSRREGQVKAGLIGGEQSRFRR